MFKDLGPVLTITQGDTVYRGLTVVGARDLKLPEAAILAAAKVVLAEKIDARAEALRARISTPGAGQAMEYEETRRQAVAALQSPDTATAALYPMLGASIGIDVDPSTKAPAADVLGVARAVIASYDQWRTLGGAIRAARLAGKKAVAEAATEEAASAAYDAIQWPALST